MEENYVLSTNENLTLSVNIIDDSVVEEREFIGITFVSNVTNDIRLFIFIRDNDRKCNVCMYSTSIVYNGDYN